MECEVDGRAHFRITIFWDVRPCALVSRYQPFEETCCFHPQGEQVPKKHWYISAKLHGVTPQNKVTTIKSHGFIWLSIGTGGGILCTR
jgi:hypothetical protein